MKLLGSTKTTHCHCDIIDKGDRQTDEQADERTDKERELPEHNDARYG